MMARIQYLDGLRGWAALVVVTHHMLMSFYPALYWPVTELLHTGAGWEQKIHGTPLSMLYNGGLAVAVFLVLSGYVLAMQFRNQTHEKASITYFGINRLVRFLGLMVCTNLLAYLAIASGLARNIEAAGLTLSWGWLGNQWKMIPSFIEAIGQSFMGLFYMYPIDHVYNSSIWTMPLFFLGGFLVAIMFQLTANLKHKWILYGLMLIVLMRGNYYLLLMGMMLYEFKLFSRPLLSHPLVVGLLMVIGIFFGGYPYVYQTSNLSPWYSWLPVLNFAYTSTFYHGISAIALMTVLINSRLLQRLFSTRLFAYLGRRSFSLYLVHVVVILSLMSQLFVWLFPHYSYGVAFGISAFISLFATLLLTELLYQLIEKRSGRTAHYLFQRIA